MVTVTVEVANLVRLETVQILVSYLFPESVAFLTVLDGGITSGFWCR